MTISNFNLSTTNLDNFILKLKALDLENVRYVANVKEKKTTRSIEQNARLWKLYTELGNHIGETPDRVHELMGYKFLRELITVNGETFENIKTTTKLTTAQMADYQTKIEQWAVIELGFYFDD
jgi:hypothetical protein